MKLTVAQLTALIQTLIRQQPPNNLRSAEAMDDIKDSFLPLEIEADTTVNGLNSDITFSMVEDDFSIHPFIIDCVNSNQPYHSRFTANSFSLRWESDRGIGLEDFIYIDPAAQSYQFGEAIRSFGGVTRLFDLAGSGTQIPITDNSGNLSTTTSGSDGQVLTRVAGSPAWATPSAGVPQVYRSGHYYSYQQSQVALTTQALAAGTLRAFPFKIEAAVTFDEIRAEVTTSVALSTVRFCLYVDNGSGYPGALVANSDSGDLSSASNAVITTGTLGTPITLTAGNYWLAANSSHTPTMRSFNFIAMPPFMGLHSVLGSGNQPTGWTVASAYGAPPATYPAGATLATVVGPAVIFRKP